MRQIWTESFLCKPKHGEREFFYKGRFNMPVCSTVKIADFTPVLLENSCYYKKLFSSIWLNTEVFMQEHVFSSPFVRSYNSVGMRLGTRATRGYPA